jgi:hypothetical protein
VDRRWASTPQRAEGEAEPHAARIGEIEAPFLDRLPRVRARLPRRYRAIVETADAPRFTRLLERHVSGADASYWSEEHLGVLSDMDEVWFRIAVLDEAAIGDIRQVGEGGYLLPSRLSDDVHCWLHEGLFEGAAATLTVVGLEVRTDSMFRRLTAALDEARVSFVGQLPQLRRA